MSRLPTYGSTGRRSDFPGSESDIQSGNVKNDVNQTSTGENVTAENSWQRYSEILLERQTFSIVIVIVYFCVFVRSDLHIIFLRDRSSNASCILFSALA